MDFIQAVMSGDEEQRELALKIGRIQKEIAKNGVESVEDWPDKMDGITDDHINKTIREMNEVGEF